MPRSSPPSGDRVPDVALGSFTIRPNQPETGELRLHVSQGLPVHLGIGSQVTVTPLEHLAHVSVSSLHGEVRTWFSERVRIERRSGLHVVSRDGLGVGDLDSSLEIACLESGLTRVRV